MIDARGLEDVQILLLAKKEKKDKISIEFLKMQKAARKKADAAIKAETEK
jgi:hypothetical protein